MQADDGDEQIGVAMGFLRETGDPDDPYEAVNMPPAPDQLVAVSAGVFEGRPVEAVRYPSEEHMSGWYIFTDLYDDDIESLTLHHAEHVIEARPDFADFLSLPYGCHFAWSNESSEYVWWFDKEALEDDE